MYPFYCAIESTAFIYIAGADAQKFLQGQTSCDFTQASCNEALLGSFNSPQGRVLCTFKAFKFEEGFLLQTHNTIIDKLLAHLVKYAAFFKVTLSNYELNLHGLGLQGRQWVEFLGLNSEQSVTHTNSFVAIKLGEDCFELWLKPMSKEYDCLFESLEQQFTASLFNWDNIYIQQGMAWINCENYEQYVAQQLNLDLIGAINFKKGCYTGQEIIARLHYKGKSKKRLLRLQTTKLLSINAPIYNAKQKNIGQVICSSNDQVLVCAVINEQYFFDKSLAQPLKLLDLPYSIPE